MKKSVEGHCFCIATYFCEFATKFHRWSGRSGNEVEQSEDKPNWSPVCVSFIYLAAKTSTEN